VEDDEDDALLFRRAMEKVEPGCPIQVATDGQMAIDYFAGSGKFQDRQAFPLPCLVLLDLKLPQVPGLDVLKWIRGEARSDVPVVILSSSQHKEDVSTAYKLRGNAYLVKPSDPAQLLEIAKMIALILKHL
ncbi:MAG: response regulator with CheY-like receiver domain and winged-helix DNA-binding domain, partial [Pedosphaera sp.]|nr:response regulator with CheY-like receiver domain and winged-helix DNA-binding domain [Pedosphaera sp.]